MNAWRADFKAYAQALVVKYIQTHCMSGIRAVWLFAHLWAACAVLSIIRECQDVPQGSRRSQKHTGALKTMETSIVDGSVLKGVFLFRRKWTSLTGLMCLYAKAFVLSVVCATKLIASTYTAKTRFVSPSYWLSGPKHLLQNPYKCLFRIFPCFLCFITGYSLSSVYSS